jgi:hypothetical protein
MRNVGSLGPKSSTQSHFEAATQSLLASSLGIAKVIEMQKQRFPEPLLHPTSPERV